MSKTFTAAVLGCGARGLDTYSKFMTQDNRFQIVAACDFRQTRLDSVRERLGVPKENCFLDEEEFFQRKRADVLVVATQDQDHVRHAIRALNLGYDILLEKPISPSKQECLDLLEAKKRTGRKVVVCHVLRYAGAYQKVVSLIEEGIIGELQDIHAIEQVGYWHIAHSFVRGNWRNSNETSPMILAKCCHDMDLLQFFAKSRCKTVSSVGSLSYFKKENQPKGAADRCNECQFNKTCPYSSYNIYIGLWEQAGKPESMWPQNVVCLDLPLTEEKIVKAYSKNQYGRCVFACDNNVVDHQEANFLFENGITANLCMTGFTARNSRIYRFHGTIGEIVLDEEQARIVVKPFGKPEEIIPFSEILKVSSGHGGGDTGLIDAFYDALCEDGTPSTTLEASIESHLMAFAAEESRLENGKCIKLH